MFYIVGFFCSKSFLFSVAFFPLLSQLFFAFADFFCFKEFVRSLAASGLLMDSAMQDRILESGVTISPVL